LGLELIKINRENMSIFDKLWEAFPSGKPCSTNGKANFENQCAIRMGVCLEGAGINTQGWPLRRCWQHKGKERHILAAEELAKTLSLVSTPGIGKVEKYSGEEGFAKIKGRRGIVFFKNYYGQGLQGDHIDLWKGWRTTDLGGSITVIFIQGGGNYKKGEIWFWPVP
jgi:hypothetical protein